MRRLLPLFLLAIFCWLVFLDQGLFIGDHDDWDHVLNARETAWQPVIGNLLKPWSSSPYWHGQGSFADHVLHERVFTTFYLKTIVSAVSPDHSFLIFFLYKSLPFLLSILFMALLLQDLVRNAWVRYALLLFYTLIPVHYLHVLWLSDPATLVNFFILFSLFIFLKIERAFAAGKKPAAGLLLFFFSILWLAIKTKSSALIAPLFYSAYALLSCRAWMRAGKTYFLFLAGCGLVAFQIVPVEHLGLSAPGHPFSLENIQKLLFFNPDSIFGVEPAPAWRDLHLVFPASVLRAFGFFSFWLAVLYLAVWLFLKKQEGFLKHPLARLSLIWLAIEIPLMGIFIVESRYFSGTFIPLIFLLGRLMDQVVLNVHAPAVRKTLLAAAIAGLGISTLINVKHILWLKSEIDSRYHTFFHMAQAVFLDKHPEKKSAADTGHFYTVMYQPDPKADHIEKSMASTVYGLSVWKQTQSLDAAQWKDLAARGFCYDVTHNPNAWPAETARMIAEIKATPEHSWYSRLLARFKPVSRPSLYIYKSQDCHPE